MTFRHNHKERNFYFWHSVDIVRAAKASLVWSYGTATSHSSNSCGNILAFFAQGELGSALRRRSVPRIFPSGSDPYAVLLVAPWRTGPPLQPKPLVPVGFNRVGPETLMPPPSQLTGRDVATAQMHPLRRV